ncbi:MAG TPA: hypothetical protein VH700_17595 [Gemmatimonadales bacterium]
MVTVTAGEQYAAGLAPERLGGGLETRSLKLNSADGREFAFRPVDKVLPKLSLLPSAERSSIAWYRVRPVPRIRPHR